MYTVVLMAALATSPAATGFKNLGCTSCSGCHGRTAIAHTNSYCHGCSCSGYSYGCSGNYTIYAPPACSGVFGCTGCYGCYGGWSCYGVALPHHGYWNECAPGTAVPEKIAPKTEETPAPKELKSKEEARARVIIDAPAEAKIYVDGQLVYSAKRIFYTPDLVAGQKYFYDVRAEIVRDGQTFMDTQRVILGAGHSVTAAFPSLNQEATLTVRTGE